MKPSIDPLERLPVRFPFVFVDRLVSWSFRSRAVAEKCFTVSEPWCAEGAFVPRTLLIETLLQTSYLMLQDLNRPLAAGTTPEPGFLVALRNFKFHGDVGAGEKIVATVTLESEVLSFLEIRGTLTTESGREIVSGVLTVTA